MRGVSIAGGVTIAALFSLGACSVLLDGSPKPADASEDAPRDDGAADDEASHDSDRDEDTIEEPAADLHDLSTDDPDRDTADEGQEPPVDVVDIEPEDVPCETVFTLESVFAEKDTYISAYEAGTNYGDDTEMIIYRQSAEPVRQALLQFNLAHISAGTRIAAARLVLVYTGWDGDEDIIERHAGAYEIQSTWSENEVTWETRPAFSATPEDTINMPCCVENVWDITDLVRRWLSDPASNHGVMISPENTFSYHFGTMQNGYDSTHPRLEVDICL